MYARDCVDPQTKVRVCKEIGIPSPCWFVKRGGKDRGVGILTCFSIEELENAVEGLNKNLSDSEADERVRNDELLLVQQCPERLMLWKSRKFHLRVFVLSPKHLNRVWLFKDAICYASTSTYEEKSRKRDMHLTNFSQQDSVANDTFQGVASKCLRSKNWFRQVSKCVYDVFSELRSSLVDDKDEVEDENLFDIELLGLDMILTSSESCCSEQIVGGVKLLEINQLPTVDVSRQTEQVQQCITRPMINGILDVVSSSPSDVWKVLSFC